MPTGIYPRLVRKAVRSVLIVKPSRPGEMERKVDVLKIPLGKNKWAIVDPSMKNLGEYNWHYSKYVRRWTDIKKEGMRSRIYVHHCIVGFPLHGMEVDHRNGDKLDNRLENLRIVTHRENQANNPKRRMNKTSSKYVGVYWNKRDKSWVAAITINGQIINLGYFKNEDEAGDAYQKALIKI